MRDLRFVVVATAVTVWALAGQPWAQAVSPAGHASAVRVVARQVTVTNGAALSAALRSATPGTTIVLADGVYTSRDQFTVATACSAAAPCVLRGGRRAVLEGGGVKGHYGLHVRRAAHWTLSGFSVREASKGIVLDASSRTVIDRVDVRHIGEEGIHLRAQSVDNVVRSSDVHDTGVVSPQYGEGIYVGSAVSNWATYTGGQPDSSDRNVISGNHVWDTRAESVDIKEGTSAGTVSGNRFDGTKLSGKNSADSWVDVKGNGWQISNNVGTNALLDGYQTHVLVDGWGMRNVFSRNNAAVNSSGYGFRFHNASTTRNVVRCDNVVTGAGSGPANQTCA